MPLASLFSILFHFFFNVEHDSQSENNNIALQYVIFKH